MSQAEIRQIERSLELSASFHHYMLKHPKVMKGIPKGAQIVFDEDAMDSKEKGVYHAVRKGGKWTLLPL